MYSLNKLDGIAVASGLTKEEIKFLRSLKAFLIRNKVELKTDTLNGMFPFRTFEGENISISVSAISDWFSSMT